MGHKLMSAGFHGFLSYLSMEWSFVNEFGIVEMVLYGKDLNSVLDKKIALF